MEFKNYLKSEIVTIGTITVAKTTHDYSFGSTAYTRTTKSYYDASNFLTTTTKAYRSDAAYFDADRPLRIEHPDGRQMSFVYEVGANGASKTWIVEGSHTGGTQKDSVTVDGTSIDFESILLVGNKSTITQIIRNQDDNIISEKVFVWNGSAFDATPVVNTSTAWLDGVRREYRVAVNGAVEDWGWQGAYMTSMTDTSGIQHVYAYDSVGRLQAVTKTGVSPSGYAAQGAVTKTYKYHPTNQVMSVEESGGSLSRLTTYAYDGAGRPTGSILPDNRTMGNAYSFIGSAPKTLVITETLSCGGTVTTHTLPGGNVHKVLSPGVDRYYHYAVDANGNLTTEVRYGADSQTRYEQVLTDWLGRPRTRTRPGAPSHNNVVETFTPHPTTGLLIKTEYSNGLAPEYRVYDDMGRLVRVGLDVDVTAGLAENSASDRITDIITEFTKIGSDWWTSTERKIYATANSGMSTSLGSTRRQLSGLSGAGAKIEQVDRFGLVTSIVTSVNTTDRMVTVTTSFPGVGAGAQQITINGNAVSELSPDGRSVEYTYDGLGRRSTAVDSHNGTTTYSYDEVYANGVYNDTDRLHEVIDPNNLSLAIYGYDDGGRVNVVQTPAGTYRYSYDCAGRLKAQWGAAQPAAFNYNSYGERDGMRTFTSGDYTTTEPTYAGGDLTTWYYHEASGLLQYKKHGASNQVDYTYNARGLVDTRRWARTNGFGQRVTTTYGYADKLTELTSKSYSNDDGLTPNVTLAYTRAGLPYQGGDGSIGSSTFTYSGQLELQTETLPATFYGNRVLSRQYDAYHRPSGFKLGTSGDDDADLTQTHTFDGSTGLLHSIVTRQATLDPRTFTYGYVSDTSLLETLSTGSGGTLFEVARTYETIDNVTKRDLLASIQATYGGGAAITRHDYTYNSARQRISAKQAGSAFADYGAPTFYRYEYNGRGELRVAAGYLGSDVESYTGSNALPGRYYEFGYDNQGNRTSANSSGLPTLASAHTVNGLNQITGRENQYLPVSGTVDSAAKVVVNGELAGKLEMTNYWSGEVMLDNMYGPAMGSISIKAAKTSPETVEITSTTGLIAEENETLDYDADGNLTSDGLWDYVYDAENRLVRMTSNLPSTGVFSGYDRLELEFAYDYLGRRIRKQVENLRTSSIVSTRRYLYDGWNLVSEFAESGGAIGELTRSYAWGLDLAGSLTATGGVGALVQLSVHDSTTVTDFYPTYDGNGNVTALVKSNGTLAAVYEYGPFGEALRVEELDPLVAGNPFRFSTKFTDVETGLIYYGHRYYSTALGRFINRDPIGEAGGLNLYAFVGNDPVNSVDVLGLMRRVCWWEERDHTREDGAFGVLAVKVCRYIADDVPRDREPPLGNPGDNNGPIVDEDNTPTENLSVQDAAPRKTGPTQSECDKLISKYSAYLKNRNFGSVDEAAVSGLLRILTSGGVTPRSIEYAFSIYRDNNDQIQLGQFVTNRSDRSVNLGLNPFFRQMISSGRLLAWGHNHPPPGGESFSGFGGDKGFSDNAGPNGIPGYVVTPTYRILRYDPPDLSNWNDADTRYGYAKPQGTVSEPLLPPEDVSQLIDCLSAKKK